MWFTIFLSLSNITHLFPMYIRISSTVLKFLQVFRKLAVFPLRLTKFSIFLKSTCLLDAIFQKFIFNQKEKRGFIWSKTFSFLFQKPNFYSEKKEKYLSIFVKSLSNKHEHKLFHRYNFRSTYLKEHLLVDASIISIERLKNMCKWHTPS